MALLQKDADRKIEVNTSDENSATASNAQGAKPAATAAASRGDGAQRVDHSASIGSIVNTSA